MNVAVIGGGYAGMAAAVTLAQHGMAATVFEAAPQLGGRARRIAYNDAALDNGLHILIGAYRETLRLIELVNPDAGHALLRLPLDWQIHGHFRLRAAPLPAPLHLALGLLSARGAGLNERIAAAAFMRALRRINFRLPQDMPVSELLRQHRQGATITRRLWHPLCIAALNTPPDVASAQVFVNVLRDSLNASRADSEIMLSRVDLSALFPDPAADYVRSRGGRVLTGHMVDAVARNGESLEVQARGEKFHFAHVVCALPPHRAARVIAGLPLLGEAAALVERFRYQPIYTIYLQYPGRVALPAPMLGMAGGLAQWVFDRGAICDQNGLIAAVISTEGPHQDLTQDELAQRIHTELEQHFGPLPAPLWQRVIAEKRATFACAVNLQRPAQRTPLKNFHLAGDYTEGPYPATLEAAVRSGISCAQRVIASPRSLSD
ncbi:MAG: hydroxysqualene dehydroxylase HpnE [Burkholderiales bacterium]|nr:hydroxysqualene dehydroxylase HpnE [Burkholderiales bacterium]